MTIQEESLLQKIANWLKNAFGGEQLLHDARKDESNRQSGTQMGTEYNTESSTESGTESNKKRIFDTDSTDSTDSDDLEDDDENDEYDNTDDDELAEELWPDLAAAKDPATSVERLHELARSTAYQIREAVAEHPRLPFDLIIALATDENTSVRYAAKSRDIEDEELATQVEAKITEIEELENQIFEESIDVAKLPALASSPYDVIRMAVAGHTETDSKTLERLSDDRCVEVRDMVALHDNTSVHVLEKLSRDAEATVRISIAIHDLTPIDVLEKLASDPDVEVRKTVVENERLPINILHALSTEAREADEDVRNAAREALEERNNRTTEE